MEKPIEMQELGFVTRAVAFFEAALCVEKHLSRPGHPMTPLASHTGAYYLAGHSLELLLKAFLLDNGMTDQVLRSREVGHDLEACFKLALDHGLEDLAPLSDEDKELISILNREYSDKAFEYYKGARVTQVPRFSAVEGLMRKLFPPICKHVGARQPSF